MCCLACMFLVLVLWRVREWVPYAQDWTVRLLLQLLEERAMIGAGDTRQTLGVSPSGTLLIENKPLRVANVACSHLIYQRRSHDSCR